MIFTNGPDDFRKSSGPFFHLAQTFIFIPGRTFPKAKTNKISFC